MNGLVCIYVIKKILFVKFMSKFSIYIQNKMKTYTYIQCRLNFCYIIKRSSKNHYNNYNTYKFSRLISYQAKTFFLPFL